VKLLTAFLVTNSVTPVLSALRTSGGRPFVRADGEPPLSEYESLLPVLVSDANDPGEVVRFQAIYDDDAADRSIAAVASAAQIASKGRSIVLVTPWNGGTAAESAN
jgi:hypothetical protein